MDRLIAAKWREVAFDLAGDGAMNPTQPVGDGARSLRITYAPLRTTHAHRSFLHPPLRLENAAAINTSIMESVSKIAAETLVSVWTIVASAWIDCCAGPVMDVRLCEAVAG